MAHIDDIDDIEFYGRALEEGMLSPGEAADRLVRASGGGVTAAGAASELRRWKTLRKEQEALVLQDNAQLAHWKRMAATQGD